jgi:hypothetical protein
MTAATLDRSEAELVDVDKQTSGDRLWTNFFVYGAFALLAVLVQLPILLIGSGTTALITLPFGVLVTALAFAVSWLVVGVISPKGSSRSPLLGAGISLLGLLPVLVLIVSILF